MLLKNAILLVTGGSSGIGLALTKKAAAAGAHVLVADLTPFPLPTNSQMHFVKTDVTKNSDMENCFSG
jgi:NAD(P)-dependent dehydrogenase (short-subunit alcohol dehydrogenase family)